MTVAATATDDGLIDRAPSSVALKTLRLGDALAVVGNVTDGDASDGCLVAGRWLATATGRTDIAISRRASGRPRLAPPYRELAVSLSSSTGHRAAAFSPTRIVGVDIEVADTGVDAVALARDHFTTAEAKAIAEMARDFRDAAHDLFWRLWVAKEAALKTTGRGVFDGLAEPDLSDLIAAIRHDGRSVTCRAGLRLPALTIATWRLAATTGASLYCGLATAD